MNFFYFWYFFLKFLHLQIHPRNFEDQFESRKQWTYSCYKQTWHGQSCHAKKMKRMESQNTLLIRESEMEEETHDKMFVRYIQ